MWLSGEHVFPSPKELRQLCEHMGGAYIKLAQMLSLRLDVLPKSYCNELAKLQDRVAPESFATAKKALKHPEITKIYTKPLGSGSIGQVHKVKLKSGQVAAAKFKRPGVDEVFEKDIRVLLGVANHLNKYFPDFHLPRLAKEFARYTREELDFSREQFSIQSFPKDTGVGVPKVYKDLCTQERIVMEFIDGKPWDEAAKKKHVPVLVRSFFRQVFEHSTFHADPHPGNIFVVKDQLVFLDFGIIGHLTKQERRHLMAMVLAVQDQDTDTLLQQLMILDMATYGPDRAQLGRDLETLYVKYGTERIGKLKIGAVLDDVFSIIRQHGIRIPTDFVLFAKAVMTLEAVCSTKDPSFALVDELDPYVDHYMSQSLSPTSLMHSAAKAGMDLLDVAGRIGGAVDEGMMHMRAFDEKLGRLSAQVENVLNVEKRFRRSVSWLALALALSIFALAFANAGSPALLGLPAHSVFLFAGAITAFILAIR